MVHLAAGVHRVKDKETAEKAGVPPEGKKKRKKRGVY